MEQQNNATDRFVVSDAIMDLEDRFPLKELLAVEYFKKYRTAYEQGAGEECERIIHSDSSAGAHPRFCFQPA